MEDSANLTRVKLAILNIFTDILRTILSYYTPASHLSDTLKGIGIPIDNQDSKQSDEVKKHMNNLNSKRKDDMKKLLDNQDLLKWAAENKSYENLDITLMKALFSIFRELARINKTEISEEKDKIFVYVVDEIRKTRNTFFHESEHSISKDDFKNTWKNLELICLKVDKETQGNFSQTLQKYRQCVVKIDVDTQRKLNSLQVKFRHPETLPKEILKKSELVEKWKNDSSRFFPTRAFKEVERRLCLTRFLTVSGNAGSGKSSCAKNVALSYILKDWIIIPVDDIEEIITWVEKDSKGRQLFVLDDPLGKDHINERLFSHWKCHESTFTHILNSCDIKVLFTCRKNILNDKRMPDLLIKEMVVIDNRHWQLTTFEKEKILYLNCVDKVEVSESEKNEILKSNEYNPLLCALFAQKDIYRSRGSLFFMSPYFSIRDEIKNYKENDRIKYCALVILLERGGSICHETLTKNRQALETVFQICKLSSNISYKSIFDELENLNGSLVQKIGGDFTFKSDIVVNALVSILQKESQKELLRFCPLGVLRKWIRVDDGLCDERESSSFCHITATDETVNVLCDRYFEEIKKNCVEVCLCPVFKDSRVQASILKRITEMPDVEVQECFLQSLRMGVSPMPPFMYFNQITIDLIKHFIPDIFRYIDTKMHGPYISPISVMVYSLEFLLNNEEFAPLVQSRMKKPSSAVNLVNELKNVRDIFTTFCGNLDGLDNFEATKIYYNEVLKIIEIVDNKMMGNEEGELKNEELEEYGENKQVRKEHAERGEKKDEHKEKAEQGAFEQVHEEQIEQGELEPVHEEQTGQEERKKKQKDQGENGNVNSNRGELRENEHVLFEQEEQAENKQVHAEHDEQAKNEEIKKKQEEKEQMHEVQEEEEMGDLFIKIQQVCNSDEWATKAMQFAFSNYLKNIRNELSSHQERVLNDFLNNYAVHFANIFGIIVNDMGSSTMRKTFTCWSDALKRFELLELCFPFVRNNNRKTFRKQILSELLLTSNAPDFPYLSLPSLEQTKLHAELQGFTSSRSDDIKTELAIYAYQMSPLSCLLMFGENEIYERVFQRVLDMHSDMRLLYQCNLFFSACVNGRLDIAKCISKVLGKNAMTEKFFFLTFDFCPLHIAPLLNHVEIMDYLLREGRLDVNIVDYYGNTPLHLVLNNIMPNLVEQHYQQILITIKTLCDFGANTNQQNNMGYTHLHVACKNNYTEVVELFCNESNINSETHFGDTPLLIAAEKGNAEVVGFLLQHGANSNDKNDKGYTPLHLAAKRGSLQTIEKLLNNNADLNIKSNQGETPLFAAASKGHFDVVKLIIKITSRVNDKDKRDVTVLAEAVSSGRLDTVNLLLQNKANVNLPNNHGNGPLAVAAIKGYLDIFELLILNGANLELCNDNGESPLILASIHGQSEIVQLLLNKGANLNRQDHKKQSSLWHACKNGHTCVTSILIKHDVNEKLCDLQGCTPFFTAARHGHLGPLEVLLQTKCPVNQRDGNDKTALMTACENGHVGVVCTLLKYVANTNLSDNNGRTALWHASKWGYTNVVEVLLDDAVDCDKRDKELKSPLYAATEEGCIEIVSMLVGRNASMELCDKKRRSPLSIASAKGHMFIVKFLSSEGADVNTKDIFGWTPLFYAVGNSKKDTVLLLLEFRAKVDITDKEGNTPLHIAAGNGFKDIVWILVDRGNASGINRQNEYGETAFFLACTNNYIETASFLISRNADISIPNKNGLSPFEDARRNGNNAIVSLLSQCIN